MNWIRRQKDRRLTDRPHLVTTGPTSGKLGQAPLRRRYGVELLGALLFIAAIVAFNSYDHGASSQGSQAQSSATHATTITQTPATPTNKQAAGVVPNSPANAQEDSSMTQSSSNDNTVDTHVTVNGVDLAVPVNGTSQQTVTTGDGGNTTVTISNNQATSGEARGSSHISTHLHVSTTTLSNDSVSESVSKTP
ncbi:MAG: hypothetical protein ABI602_03520 [Candidatus Saccharibacteria bacterium]